MVKPTAPINGKNEVVVITDVPGLMISIAPIKAAAIPMMRRRPIFSPKTITAPNVTITGPS